MTLIELLEKVTLIELLEKAASEIRSMNALLNAECARWTEYDDQRADKIQQLLDEAAARHAEGC